MPALGTVRRITLILAACLSVLGASAAWAQPAATWNDGYGWWPPGFGYAPMAVGFDAHRCTVTAAGPTFLSYPREWRQDDGGAVACAGTAAARRLTVSVQVLGRDHRTWYTLGGSRVTYAPSALSPLRIIRNRPAHLGHVYRVAVTARIVVSNGHDGCSLSHTCAHTITATVISRRLAP